MRYSSQMLLITGLKTDPAADIRGTWCCRRSCDLTSGYIKVESLRHDSANKVPKSVLFGLHSAGSCVCCVTGTTIARHWASDFGAMWQWIEQRRARQERTYSSDFGKFKTGKKDFSTAISHPWLAKKRCYRSKIGTSGVISEYRRSIWSVPYELGVR